MASPVFKTAWAAVRSPEGSTPFLLRQRNKNQDLGSGWSLSCSPAVLAVAAILLTDC